MTLRNSRLTWRIGEEPDGSQPWAFLSAQTVVPRRVDLRALGFRGGPDADIRFEILNGVPEVVDLRLHLSPKGRGVRSSDVMDVQQVEDLARTAFLLFARAVHDGYTGSLDELNIYQDATPVLDLGELMMAPPMEIDMLGRTVRTVGVPDLGTLPFESTRTRTHRDLDRAVVGKRSVPRAELEQVARVYRDNIDKPPGPTDAVGRFFGYTPRTASRRVKQARELDLLPETTQGRKLI